MFKKILLAADGSSHSLRAAEKAIELAQYLPKTSIDVVFVVDGKTSKEDVLYNWNAQNIETKRKDRMAEFEQKAKKNNIQYSIKILRGDPGSTIINYANVHQVDIIILGSRGLNTMQEMLLGSVSHKVAKRAHCPVLIIK